MTIINYTTTYGNTYEIMKDYAFSTSIDWSLDFDTLQEVKDYCEAYDKAQAHADALAQLGVVALDCFANIINLKNRLPEVKYIYVPNKAALAIFGEWTGSLVDCYKVSHTTIPPAYAGSALFVYYEDSDTFQEADSEISAVIHSLLNR